MNRLRAVVLLEFVLGSNPILQVCKNLVCVILGPHLQGQAAWKHLQKRVPPVLVRRLRRPGCDTGIEVLLPLDELLKHANERVESQMHSFENSDGSHRELFHDSS